MKFKVPQESLPNVVFADSGDPSIVEIRSLKRPGVEYASDSEVCNYCRKMHSWAASVDTSFSANPENAMRYREFLQGFSHLAVYGIDDNNRQFMIAPVPFDHMTEDEKELYLSQTVKHAPRDKGWRVGLSLREVFEREEGDLDPKDS